MGDFYRVVSPREKSYAVFEIAETKDYGVLTGQGLMNLGLPNYLRGDMKSEVIRNKAVD